MGIIVGIIGGPAAVKSPNIKNKDYYNFNNLM